MIRKQTTLSLSPHHRKYPPRHSQQKKGHEELLSFISMYYSIRDNYYVNGSFCMLHYYFCPVEHVQSQQSIDFGIPYIQSEQGDIVNNQSWQQPNIQPTQDLEEENFTDNEMKDDDEDQQAINEKLAFFGTNCQTTIHHKSIQPYDYATHLTSKSIHSKQSTPQVQSTLQKTAYFQKQPPKNKIKINLKLNKEIDSIKKTTSDQLDSTINVENFNHSNQIQVSKKHQFLEKIKKQKQKKQKQWDKYIERDKQYLQKYLK